MRLHLFAVGYSSWPFLQCVSCGNMSDEERTNKGRQTIVARTATTTAVHHITSHHSQSQQASMTLADLESSFWLGWLIQCTQEAAWFLRHARTHPQQMNTIPKANASPIMMDILWMNASFVAPCSIHPWAKSNVWIRLTRVVEMRTHENSWKYVEECGCTVDEKLPNQNPIW
jgi:hypothetical protein